MRALVIGGGLGGVAAGIALRRAGVDAVVFERSTSLEALRSGAGMHLWPNAMRVVSQLGLDEQMIEAGSPEERMEFWSTRGRRLATFEVGDWGRETGFPMVSIRRGQGGGDHAVVVDSRPLRELAAPRSHARPRCRDAHRVSVVREPTTKRFCAYEV